MCVSSEPLTELECIIQGFEERFRPYQGRRIALYPGEYLEEIVRLFDPVFHFQCLEPDSTEVPPDIDLVILTDPRKIKEPDYCRIHESCEKQGVLLFDLFGIDQIKIHRELEGLKYLTIPQWKQLLSDYDVITISAPGPVVKYNLLQDRWVARRRFLILYKWLLSIGKTVRFFQEREELLYALDAEQIDIRGLMFERTENDFGFLQLIKQYTGKKIIHIGTNMVKDGIVPRDYGIDSRLIKGFRFSGGLSHGSKEEQFYTDRKLLTEAIDAHDVISFDIFDTLLKRTVLYPKTVFEITEKRTGIQGFADVRYQIQTTSSHLSLDEIYDCLKDRCGYDDPTLEKLRRTELQTESDVIIPRSSMTELFEYAKNRDKTIVLVSDMYLDPDFIHELLKKNGISGYSELYLSYRYKKLKHEGLFEEMLKNRKPGETILHIGDNRYADYVSARKYGLDAFWVPSCLDLAIKNGYEKIIKECRTLTDMKLLGLSVALGFDDPFEQNCDRLISNMIIAPLALGYLLWVCGKLTAKKYDLFLLSSRDGMILLDAYNRLQRRFPDQLPPGKYFYINRHAAFLTVMDDFELVKYIINLSKYEENLTLLFLRQFCLPADKLLPYHGESPEEFYYLHKQIIDTAAEQYRENYRKYMDREEIAGKACAVMDFVAEGTSQMMLEKHLTDTMDGFYIGVPEYIFRYARNISYFFDQDLIDYSTEMKLEVYFTSMEPALDHINDQGRPVFAEETRDRNVLDRIAEIHDQVRHYLDKYLDRLYDPDDASDKDMIFELCKTVNYYEVDNFYYDDMSGQKIKTGA